MSLTASKRRYPGLVFVILALIVGMASESYAIEPLVEAYIMFAKGQEPITEIGPGESFKVGLIVEGPVEGLVSGYADVTVSGNDGGFSVDSSTVNLNYLQFNLDGSYNPSLSLFDDYGGETSQGGYCGGYADWWFEAECTANSTPGTTMVFTPGQGKDCFQICNGRELDQTGDVFWGIGSLNVVPEPVPISLFALSGLAFLRRRRISKS